MEMDQIQRKKSSRISNGYGRFGSPNVGRSQEMDDEEEGEHNRSTSCAGGAGDPGGGGGVGVGGAGGFYGWPSSRIVRVSRASGGKDRHSKVLTSKGLRDRRVRLSVNTAIQFYDLQDRLGYDQPSKALEWLLAAAASSIADLPPMNSPFGDIPKQLRDEKRSTTAAGGGGGGNPNYFQPEQATKSSGGSSNSDTSKGSGASISRSESRIKARERAKERVVENKKEKDDKSSRVASFTELLSGRMNCVSNGHNYNSNPPNGSLHQIPMDYFTGGLLGPPATRPSQMVAPPLFSVAAAAADHDPELQPFSFPQEIFVSAANAANSPGVAAFNRGTLQSNSPPPPPPPLLPPSFFIGAAAPVDNHHHFLSGFDAGLQLYYGNTGRNSGQKERESN